MVPQVVPYCVTVGKMIEVALQARERRDFNILSEWSFTCGWMMVIEYSFQQQVLTAHQNVHVM